MPLAIKIIIPLVIVAIIATIAIIKINQKENAPTNTGGEYPLAITSVNLEAIKNYGIPTVIDFGSDDCIPCKQMAPVLSTLNADLQGKAAVQFMYVWKYADGVQDFPVQTIPTQVFFDANGEAFMPSDELAKEIEFL